MGRYTKSEEMLERALRTIPLGSQTFSKSLTQFPHGVSPYFIEKGQGSHVWDSDENEYIDFINALASVTLGYKDPDVDNAVRDQLNNGVTFSLPHRLEFEVSEKIVDVVPCAEMVRFGKNGSDATSGAIRLARAYTGRDIVLVCGYHGWQDWYIGTTSRNLGVPKATQALTHTFQYNNIESLEKKFDEFYGQVAAVIIEPMNVAEPENNFLHKVKELTHKHGAVLVFDEMVTGFRYSKGGAQEYFGVTPDLATLGKGLANGYPLSAVVGNAEIMKLMEDIFFSFTFGGETLSLAAASATIDKVVNMPVIEHMAIQGEKIMTQFNELSAIYRLENIFTLKGHPSWSIFQITDSEEHSAWKLKTLLFQELYKNGVLTIGSHNMSYAHSDEDVEKLMGIYEQVLSMIRDGLDAGNLDSLLKCESLVPLFKVR